MLEAFAALAAIEPQPERAMRLAGSAVSLREAIGAPLDPTEQAQFERALASARETLGEIRAAALWIEGEDMTLEQAIEYALPPQSDLEGSAV